MAVITPDVLLNAFPETHDTTGFLLAVEISFGHLQAQIFEARAELPHFLDHIESRDWERKFRLMTAGIDDPLLEPLLLEYGIFWSEVVEVRLDRVLEQLEQPLYDLISMVRQHGGIQAVLLLGELTQLAPVQAMVEQWFDETATISWHIDQAQWELPSESQTRHFYRAVEQANLQDYYDLLAISTVDDRIAWQRINLFGPGKALTLDNQTLTLAPKCEEVYFVVARFAAVDQRIDIASLSPADIVYAKRVTHIEPYQMSLVYNISLSLDEQLHIRTTFDDEPDCHNRISTILNTEVRQIELLMAPMQVVFLVDKTLVEGQYLRCRQMIENLVAGQAQESRWLLMFFRDGIVQYIMNEYFWQTPDFLQRLRELDYPYEFLHISRSMPMVKVVSELQTLQWVGSKANYFIIFTNRQVGDNITQIAKTLREEYHLEGHMVWLASPDKLEDDDPGLMSIKPLGEVTISSLDSDFLVVQQRLREWLAPNVKADDAVLNYVKWPVINESSSAS